MSTFHVNYDEVYAETERMKRHIITDIIGQTTREYRQIQSMLRQVDGATTASLSSALEANCQVTIEAARTLERLVDFINNSTRQIEMSEQRMARIIASTRR